MIAKFNGKCKVTGQPIIAGQTEIVKKNGVWQIANPDADDNNLPVKPAGATIAIAWSEPDQDRYGDEFLRHYAAFGDDDGEPVGEIWDCSSRDLAISTAYAMMRRYNLENCINETMW